MKILLMGGSGIISSEICNYSLNMGEAVTIINRGRRKNKIDKRATLIISDLKNETVEEIRNKLDVDGYDVIVDFISYDRKQLSRSLNIAKGLCKQFIFVSSATAYITKTNNSIYVESDEIGNTGWKYASEKAACEKYLQDNSMNFDFEITIIRPYVTYGETRIPYQVIPIKYYTLLNRMLNKKPIPIFGENVKCTVTTAKDFAIGAVGLFLNHKAYGQVYHITGECITTWKIILETIGKIIGVEPIIIELDASWLRVGSRKLGFEVEEILYDKSRNMIFDNHKIKEVVPEFKGSTSIQEGLTESINYFMNNPDVQEIDFAWDARIDALLERTKLVEDKKSISIKAYSNQLNEKDRKTYNINRNNVYYLIMKFINKIRR